MKKKMIKLTSLLLCTSMLIGVLGNSYMAKAESTAVEYTSQWVTDKYSYISTTYKNTPYVGEDIEYSIEDIYKDGSSELKNLIAISSVMPYKEHVVLNLELNDISTLEFDVKEDGIYYLNFDYFDYSDSILPIEFSMKINGDYPFYETRRVIFESDWINNEEKSYDRYGNEIISTPYKAREWNNKYIMDASYRHSEPLAFELQKGINTIEIEVSEGQFYLGNLYLTEKVEYSESVKLGEAKGSEMYIIEAEYPSSRNNSSIRALSEFDVNITPNNVENKLLNTLDGNSFKEAGQSVEYQFEVEQDGYYKFALNYLQTKKSDFPVFIDLRIDDEISHENFKDIPFAYNNGYELLTVNEHEGVYLEKGTHTISFTISNDPISHVIEAIENIMGDINDLSLEITKVAGTNKDRYRDLNLEEYIPGVGDALFAYADELDLLKESLKHYNPDVKQIGALYSIDIVTSQLRSLANEPNKIPYRVGELVTNTSSVTSFLANLLDELTGNNMSIDKIIVYQDNASLPKKTGFFTAISMQTEKFISSFSKQDYSTTNINPESLQVWVNRPRQYLEIMQKMIDEDFTVKTGISVDLSLMPDQNKLVLANASGDAPDIATGINYSIPFELGIRGALVDLTSFNDFKEIASRYTEGLLVPSTIKDGIYSLPETRNFYVLFYRTDILNKLGLEVPDTLEDVKNMLPELQMRGLNFFYPTATGSMKTFHGTTPILFQHGATLYDEYAGDTTINSEEAVEGFKELTELFTIYNLPVEVPSFYQRFRSGDLPIGISDFGAYNLILNAAPEIANSWEIALVPGVKDENGEVLRYTSGGMESTVMFTSNEQRERDAWEFMKWWSSAEVQSEFGQTLQITYGDEYIWSTANMEAFETLPIVSRDKKVILEQNDWIMEAPRILGTYMLERELSNAYNSVVVDGDTLRITLDNAVKRINRETERKLEEFGYIKDGEVVEYYTVPTIETVQEILNRE